MLDHFEIKVSKLTQCVEFYSLVLNPLHIECKWADNSGAGFGLLAESKTRFLIEQSDSTMKLHIAFSATDEKAVKLFHSSGVNSGYKCNGTPGLRTDYAPHYYAAFLLDPDGNNIEAVVYL